VLTIPRFALPYWRKPAIAGALKSSASEDRYRRNGILGVYPDKGRLTMPIPDSQPQRRELLKMPRSRPKVAGLSISTWRP